ncbi:MAG: segregation/condensation protein A [Christensenellaceae bacterium]|nr:segregation/condensation protein A [Christensenellaceae bacterium]
MARIFRLSQFEGPLDMLLFLIGKAKIDIKDIFVSEITDQYIAAVREAEDIDMEEASAFIQMAATLLLIKSRSLLPKPEPPQEEDPEQLLIRQLEEYAALKKVAKEMQQFEKTAAKMYEKLPEEFPLPPPTLELEGLSLSALAEAFANLLARLPEDEDEETSVHRIMREEHTVRDCMANILKLSRGGRVSFNSVLSKSPTRHEVVVVFLALLELIRLGKISCVQENTYGEIYILNNQKGRLKH